MDQIKKHPAYKEAIERILQRFDQEGYGTIITDSEFDSFLSIEPIKGEMTYEKFKSLEMERLQRYRAIDELLKENNICLIRSKAVSGFEILPPKEQIKTAYERRMTRVRRELMKAATSLLNVNNELLTMEEENDRQNKMMRTAFIKTALNKRKLEIVHPKEKKAITAERGKV